MDDYDIGQVLGVGGFASVIQANDRRRGEDVAVKCIDKEKLVLTQSMHRVRNEISIHHQLDHEHIVHFYDAFEDDKTIYLVLELCQYGNLYKYLQERQTLSETEAVCIIEQILYAVDYLHEQGYVHRDLKLSNILISAKPSLESNPSLLRFSLTESTQFSFTDQYPLSIPYQERADERQDELLHVKLCDFGLSVSLSHPDEEHFTLCGTPHYIAPEVANKDAHGYPADIWSIGALFYTLRRGQTLLENETLPHYLGGVEGRERVVHQMIQTVQATPDEFLSELSKDFLLQIFRVVSLFSSYFRRRV